ncbi:response regulator [Paenibacillus sp. MER 99-2]|uniref:response regulator n=1 Tax=Paenibacillus sp. MER 99-2 TaxID=2939572 RepID=UPI00203BFEC9|nr:response regulator [Paenibacillus sp. MER 99-2]MCM3170726.1 response regulator [Paenibacillus sp. MER 99-2]
MYKVLLVDDEPFAIEGLQLLIDWEKHGFEINGVCANGEDAVDAISREQPDLVVTDIRMPVMNGLELIEEARRLGHQSTLFVITSGYSDFNYARQAIRLGVSHYLTKPVIESEADDVLQRLRQELMNREAHDLMLHQAHIQRTKQALLAMVTNQDQAELGEEIDEVVHELSAKARKWVYLLVMIQGDGASAKQVIEQFMEGEPCGYLLDAEWSPYGIVWGGSSEDFTESDYDLRQFAERLLNVLDQHFLDQPAGESRVQIAVGCPVSQVQELTVSYRAAAEAGRFLFFDDTPLLYAEDMNEQHLLFDPDTLREADLIMELIENGSGAELSTSIWRAFNTFKDQMAAPELVHIFATQIMFRGLSLFKELGGEPNALMQDSALHLHERRYQNIEETARMLEAFCLKCQSEIGTLRERRVGGTQAMVAEYVHNHYKETITIKELAERFYIHPVHLGQSFMRKYGKGVLDLVHDLRMEEAKQQLRETDQALYIIAEQVGYRSYQHFLKQFEKRVGMKPAEYRLQSTL